MEHNKAKPLPRVLLARIKTITPSLSDEIIESFSRERVGSFRVNGNKFPGEERLPREISEEFSERKIAVEAFSALPGVFTFSREYEYAIKGTRAFYDGKIYLQGISSMLPALLLEPKVDENILDVCSAPGSKTTLMSVLMKNTGKITAIEQNQIRMEKLKHNTRLQGATNIFFVKSEAEKYLRDHEEPYDRILLDAPCSAEGRISTKNEKTYGFWSLQNIEKKSELQYTLLEASVRRLAPNGVLLYSTCTFAPEENEAVISRILASDPSLELIALTESIPDSIPHISGIQTFQGKIFSEDIEKTVRILPSRYTEGFYMAKIQKRK